MPLLGEMEKIKKRLDAKGSKRSKSENALLSELKQLDAHLTPQQLNEVRSHVTKMTGPDDGLCACCGRVL